MSLADWLLIGSLSAVAGIVAYLAVNRRWARSAVKPSSEDIAAKNDLFRPRGESLPDLFEIRYDKEEDDAETTRVGDGAGWGPRQRTIYESALTPIVFDDGADAEETSGAAQLLLVHANAQTDPGLHRTRNEDSLLVDDAENLFAIADGMGGHRGGELASQLTVKAVASAFRAAAFEGPPHDGVPLEASKLARSIQMANAGIMELANRKPELKGMGTTACVARFSPTKQRLYVGHVGDSRCYRFRAGKLVQMTSDHTMADLGVSGPGADHLSRAVGVWDAVPVDVVMAIPKRGDTYLLCSDGLTKMLPDEEIAEALRSLVNPKETVERLVASANARGGKDNTTVILIQVMAAT